jgi:hypothetical protein
LNPAPIYLLLNGEADGPHEEAEIARQLYGRKLSKKTLACIEGMPAWRSLDEVLVWSRAVLLRERRCEILELVGRMIGLQIDERSARVEALRMIGRQYDADLGESIGTILEVNTAALRNWRLCEAGQSNWNGGATDLWPAFELVKFSELRFHRDWKADWHAAGGRLFKGHMVARKDDPVWQVLSDFGFPFPPFSFDTGMWIKDVTRDEAEEIGADFGRVRFEMLKPGKPFDLVGILGVGSGT